ncbi:2-polyprenyl-3-methyl-5-hydroxy-6-metoxy-1,4-benzoquinol methylase [Caenispirillum salinarum AK4]|uniref:2-polyprenyl-3-methyl-5-hydroxy-6-metoxy-1, 4-benzoquinol methylase n=1 Tax=Caenispirillum salinarum AK4 TaxID=1238182 RepID=K9GVD6_9PROT|nr:class I SAM-dependent methyltransferase [Caenispirillum salinarum]EKV29137.1 2-polyprenyl-3-methyl-5-hydroxy-6-metoxy-1,4-benzoquinol methylase [Caenispirillum salinarum AK4]
MEYKNSRDVLFESLELEDRAVVDVGCGDGGLARAIRRAGAARVIGVECSPRQLDKARAAEPVDGVAIIDGVAEALPVLAGTMDAVVFFNSLHHVPPQHMDTAMAEAARVLRSGGRVYCSEPLAQGPFYDLCKAVDDEREVRAQAWRALHDAHRAGLHVERETVFIHVVRLKSFEAFRDRIVSVNTEREARFDAREGDLRRRFEDLGRRTEEDDGWLFDQPTRVTVLCKERREDWDLHAHARGI